MRVPWWPLLNKRWLRGRGPSPSRGRMIDGPIADIEKNRIGPGAQGRYGYALLGLMARDTLQHGSAYVNGVRLHYVTQGEGPLLILLHGFPEFWYSWRYQIPALAQHFTVVHRTCEATTRATSRPASPAIILAGSPGCAGSHSHLSCRTSRYCRP